MLSFTTIILAPFVGLVLVPVATALPSHSGQDCCFTSVEQARPFFPPGSGAVKTVGEKPASGSIACGENTVSNFSRRYALGRSEFVVRLFDYCARQGELREDYERRHRNMKKPAMELRELDGGKVYRGFAAFDRKNRSSYLLVTVDARFKLQIQGFEAANLEDIVQVLEFLPVGEIARFGK